MFFHNLDRDPDDKHRFVWTEVYRKSDDFLFHADNPPVKEYVEKQAQLATHLSIEIYGNVSNEVIEKSIRLEFLLSILPQHRPGTLGQRDLLNANETLLIFFNLP